MREFSFIHDATPDAVARKNIPTQHTHTDRAESALAEKNVLMPASGWGGSTQGRLMMIEMFIKCDAHLELMLPNAHRISLSRASHQSQGKVFAM